MAYTTGTATSWVALRTAMNTFLTSNLNWVQEYLLGVNNNDGGVFDAPTWKLGGMYWNFDFRHGTDTLQGWMSTGNDGVGTTFGNHTGTSRGTSADENDDAAKNNYITFPSTVTYHFFGDESTIGTHDYFYMVLSPQAGMYHHFWMGYINPFWGAARPYGAFMGASYMNNTQSFAPMSGSTGVNTGMSMLHYPYSATPVGEQTDILNNPGNHVSADFIVACGQNEQQGVYTPFSAMTRSGAQLLTGRTILAPSVAVVTDAAGITSFGGRRIYVGEYPGVHQMSLQSLSSEDILTVGSDQYMVFPQARRGPDTGSTPFGYTGNESGGTFNSGLLGYGYKKF